MHINTHEFVGSYSIPAFSHHMISHVHNKKREVRGACELENIVYEREDRPHLSSSVNIDSACIYTPERTVISG